MPNTTPLSGLTRRAQLVFVKVPKTASTSVQSDIRALGLDAGGVGQGERCYDEIWKADAFTLLYLRAPRQHVLSMYLECKYASWAVANQAGAEPPFPGREPVAGGFEDWVNFFRRQTVNLTLVAHFNVRNQAWRWYPDWKCYNPINAASRQLTRGCNKVPHHYYPANYPPSSMARFVSVARVASFNFVGVTELYDLSWCLLCARLGKPLPEGCFSPEQPVTRTFVSHDDSQRRPRSGDAADSMSQQLWQSVDALTEADAHVYVTAAKRLLAEAEAYQAGAQRRLGAHLLDYGAFLRRIEYLPHAARAGMPAAFSLADVPRAA